MIRVLSAIGRATIVVAALLMIVGSAAAGYFDAAKGFGMAALGGPAVGALIGLVAGTIAAGVVLGPLATLYDIRDGVRHLVRIAGGEDAPEKPQAPKAPDRQGPVTTRREPRLR